MNKILRLAAGLPLVALFAGCPEETPAADAFTPPMNDAFSPPMDDAFTPPMDDAFVAGDAPVVITNDCAGYCAQMAINCTGDDAQYIDTADCMAQCTALNWPAGIPGDNSGNSLACRIYHGGDPAATDPGLHCPHAGPTGDNTCGAAIAFNGAASGMGTRVDRMGMPAISTATISSGMKTAYNNADPANDAMLTFAPDQIGTLTTIHAALDDDLVALGLTPCSMVMSQTVPGVPVPLPNCLAQEIYGPGTGARVYQVVIPDTLRVDPGAASGFPNGREPDDRTIDVILGAALLDLTVSGQSVATLAMRPLNPPANAAGELLTTFPYFGVATPAP